MPVAVRSNPITGSFIHDYRPLRVYVYDWGGAPWEVLNFLARAILRPGCGEFGGDYLFERVDQTRLADCFLTPIDIHWSAGQGLDVLDELHAVTGNADRHLFVDSRDQPESLPVPGAISLRPSVMPGTDETNRVLCIPYVDTVDDFVYYLRSRRQLEYGLSFVGATNDLRRPVIDGVAAIASFPTFPTPSRGLLHEPAPSSECDRIHRRRDEGAGSGETTVRADRAPVSLPSLPSRLRRKYD